MIDHSLHTVVVKMLILFFELVKRCHLEGNIICISTFILLKQEPNLSFIKTFICDSDPGQIHLAARS